MDNNTWQIKCGSSGWAGSCSSSSSSSSSSSQLLHGSRNQMERSAGQCRHPYVMTPISSMDSGFGREPTVLNSMYLASCKSGKTELRNSFLALLSGPSSQVHYENKQLPNSTSGKLPLQDTGPIASNVDGGVSLIPAGGLLHHRKGNNNMANGTGLHPVNSSAEVLAYGGSFVSPFHDSHQTTNSNRQDIVKPDYQHANRGNETGTNLSSSQWGWFGSSSPSTFGHFNTTNVQASVKVPSDAKLVVSDFSAASVKGHPFVFCLATKGELLLSNTGLLGVLCCCHGLHMSVRKFCEHSGLFAVNPGEAVRLESGETIAQWRRLYFLKSGIRIPDDNTGWEWPERIPAAVSLVKCKTTGLSVSKNSDMFQMVDPFVGVVISGQPCKNVASQNASQMGHTVLEKTFNNVIQQEGNSQEGSIVFQQSLLGNTQNNLAGASDMQTRQMIKESPTAGGIAPSKSSLEKGQDDNVYQSISDYINFLTKGGGTFVSNQNMGNFKCPGTVSDINRSSSLRDGFTIDEDAIPSNIELRLGQPSQQRCTLEGLVVPAVPSEQFGAVRDCDKSMFQAPFHDGNTRIAGESRQSICYAPSDTNFRRQNQSQSNLIRHVVPGSSNVVDAAKLEQLNVDIAKSSVISMFLSRYNGATQRELQPLVDGNMINSDPVMHHVPQCESYIVHNSSDFPKNKCDERQGNINVTRLVPLSNMDKDKVPHKTGTCSNATEKADPKFYNKHITGASPFNGVIGGCHLLSSLNVNKDNIPNLHRTSGTPHLSDVGNLSNQFENGTCFGGNSRLDHALLRSPHCSNVADGSYLPISAVSMGFSSTTSIGRQNLTPLANKKGDANPCIVDENLKLHALRHVLDHSKQAHAGTFREMNSGRERVYGLSTLEMQRQTSTFVPPSASIELKDETHFIANQDASEASVKHLLACSNHFMDGGMDKSVAASGINNWCNFSTSSQPIPLRSMESDTQYPPYGSLCNKQHMLRFVGTETNKCSVPVHEYSHIQTNPNLPKECSCPVHSVSLSENSACVRKAPVDSSRGYVGNNASLQGPSILESIHMMPGDHAKAIDPCENFRRKGLMLNKCQASQWRDVPSKQKGVCNAPCIDRPAEVSNVRRNVDDQPVASAGMEVDKIQEAESLNEQQMSNVFSGCSAPAVTEVTGEVNNVGSCTIDAEDVKYVNDHVFDEGSGIAKCWSSNETFDSERSTETVNGSANIDIAKVALSSDLPVFTSRSPVDGVRSGSLRLKKVPNRSPAGCAVYNKQLEGNIRKQKKPTKWKRLDASFPASGLSSVHYDSPISHNLSSSGGKKRSFSHKHGLQISCGIPSNGHSNHKRKRSTLNSAKTLSRKRDQHELYCHHGGWENHSQKQLKDEMQICRKSKLLGEKKLKWCCNADVRRQFPQKETNQASSGKTAINDSARSVQHLDLPSYQMGACDRQPRPVVCGNSGIISNGKLIEGRAKPTKIVSLSIVLKKARSCSLIEHEEPVPSSILGTKKSCLKSEDGYSDFESDMGMETFLFEKKKERINRNEVCLAELSTLPKDSDSGCPKLSKEDSLQGLSGTPFKSKFKETRKRSLDELSGKSKLSKRYVGIRLGSAKLCIRRSLRCSFRTKHGFHGLSYLSKRANNCQCQTGELSEGIAKKSIKTHKCQTFIIDSDAFCCVCGSSNKDDINCLLQCSGCSIRVHQACYGVSKVPKGRWCCRPCKADSRNIVCVLCGYGGGAMTRALKSRNIVKSFLKAWNIADHCSSVMFKKDWHKQTDVLKSPSTLLFNSEVHNSLTAGVLDPTIKQWVHMVCGLWTPGTRCPNVDTMSAFDVSGASRPPKDVVCSMCDQFGGSYIQCRVLNCTVYFHPWCAHQKGLLQSEVEGVDNEKVGFYGRCMLHAMHNGYDPNNDPVETKVNVEKEEFSCARTECYRGRKKDGFRNAHYGRSNDNGKCLVPQEQINAWLHINGQKPSARGLLKPQSSDVEYDCRKEYARYKQAKGWKHLVVYKSGIHALGLYTSQFIPRGAMVVEYVGEIVGLRVADKREIEYQSGRKVQYKSACYFFRIDKEHIIDATRKGGIARFVNHSCLPNCVAKVISVRNEKKVVFFAERDINPGEEITYDYHFNHEDEGKKIPCFCNSKNCRRYLN